MNFGAQVSEEDSAEILDRAMNAGINFVDTAEIYSVPIAPELHGVSEEIVGRWMQSRGNRDRVILATKVMARMGRSSVAQNRTDPPGTEEEEPCLDRANIHAAVEGSLRRLQTNYIDLYQLHWTDRYVPNFGSTVYDPAKERDSVPFTETVAALKELIDAGKIKHWGISNETSYGVCRICEAARAVGTPPPISIQNDFSMCCRQFESELAECCSPRHENIGLLAYGPLAGGSLTGKYLDGNPPPGSRGIGMKFQGRYFAEPTQQALRKYQELAQEVGISLTAMALAWCNSRWYVGSTIIGVSSLAQLEEDIAAFDVVLSEETLSRMDEIHYHHKNPTMDVPAHYMEAP